ncbi:hypothetical protein [Alienimonas chondri]|uniref:Uncharacterized protein n=1 Tax=Alienimonas chondri TaxID=2681879 RepID=A0ABX1VD00_9PLAN|nr:hypothetical protein [Alienimonas chondri]NNJ25178.1 hypothetical protein [Alienimonas chondri]
MAADSSVTNPAANDPAPFYALGAGTALIVVGAAGYLLSEERSPTAFIPAGFGVILIVCGLIARSGEKALKHAMHGAAMVGLIGLIAGVVVLVTRWPGEFGLPQVCQAAMAVICAAFIALCIKSFRDARKRREAAA